MRRVLHNRITFALALLFSLTALTGSAQTADTVTIKFDDRDGITGQLIEFSNGLFRINTDIGLITIPSEDVFCIGLACPESTRLEITASPMTLTSSDGSVELSGDLIDIVDSQYVLATDVGELRINVGDVTCEGEGCLDVSNLPSFGGVVVLTSETTTIEGTLIGLEGSHYIVEVESLGSIRVNTDQFNCSGSGCPTD